MSKYMQDAHVAIARVYNDKNVSSQKVLVNLISLQTDINACVNSAQARVNFEKMNLPGYCQS